jgi:hypothetical protein
MQEHTTDVMAKKNLTGCGKFEDQCPKCVCFQMRKLRFLAGKSASSPSSFKNPHMKIDLLLLLRRGQNPLSYCSL